MVAQILETNFHPTQVEFQCVANVGFMLHYIGGDYSFTSDIILLVQVSSGRRVVMGARGST